MARTLIHVPERVRAGEVIEIRVTLSHPMETGHRRGNDGALLPRDIVRRFTCRLDGREVFSAELFPAVAAYPYFAFHLRAAHSGTLSFGWEGDNGFAHTETRPLVVGA